MGTRRRNNRKKRGGHLFRDDQGVLFGKTRKWLGKTRKWLFKKIRPEEYARSQKNKVDKLNKLYRQRDGLERLLPHLEFEDEKPNFINAIRKLTTELNDLERDLENTSSPHLIFRKNGKVDV